jgi:hypothetical protein
VTQPSEISGRRDRWRHLALLISLLLLFILSPFVVTLRFGVVLTNIVGVAVLLSGTYAVSERKRFFAVTVILAATSVILSGLIVVLPGHWTVLAGHVCLLLLLGLFSISILANVLRAGRITADKIYGAICEYFGDRICVGVRLCHRRRIAARIVFRSGSDGPGRLHHARYADEVFQFHHADNGRIRRYRSAITGRTDLRDARGGCGADLSGGAGRAARQVAHRPREQLPVAQREVTDSVRIPRLR